MLSDKCAETLDSLTSGILGHSGIGYRHEDLNKILDAIFNISKFMAKHDGTYSTSKCEERHKANKIVVNSLLEKIRQPYSYRTGILICKLAKINRKFSLAIDDVYSSYIGEDMSSYPEYHQDIFEKLKKIQIRRGVELIAI